MNAISQMIFPNSFSGMQIVVFDNQISLECGPKGPIDNETTLVQIKT